MQLTTVHSKSALSRILAFARLGYKRNEDGSFQRIVPGMPEAKSESEKWGALLGWVDLAIIKPQIKRMEEFEETQKLTEIRAEREANLFMMGLRGKRDAVFFQVVQSDPESEMSSDETDAV